MMGEFENIMRALSNFYLVLAPSIVAPETQDPKWIQNGSISATLLQIIYLKQDCIDYSRNLNSIRKAWFSFVPRTSMEISLGMFVQGDNDRRLHT